MERVLDVHIAWQSETIHVGHLWARSKGNKETSSFEYSAAWRAHPIAFALDPLLPLTPGTLPCRGLIQRFHRPRARPLGP